MKKFIGIITVLFLSLSLGICFKNVSNAKTSDSSSSALPMNASFNLASTDTAYGSLKSLDTSKSYIVTADALRIRRQPNTDSLILSKLVYGDKINPIGQLDNGWYMISYNDQPAFVCGDYIKVSDTDIDIKSTNTSYLVVINSSENTLNIYKDGNLYESYQCATGKSSSPSPEGNFQIVNKVVNPSWKGKVAGGDPKNPLGYRWMGLSVPGTGGSKYGIHGNNDESSIGKNISGGCIRMHNADVEYVFEYLPTGTDVIISSAKDTDSNIAASYGFIIK